MIIAQFNFCIDENENVEEVKRRFEEAQRKTYAGKNYSYEWAETMPPTPPGQPSNWTLTIRDNKPSFFVQHAGRTMKVPDAG